MISAVFEPKRRFRIRSIFDLYRYDLRRLQVDFSTQSNVKIRVEFLDVSGSHSPEEKQMSTTASFSPIRGRMLQESLAKQLGAAAVRIIAVDEVFGAERDQALAEAEAFPGILDALLPSVVISHHWCKSK